MIQFFAHMWKSGFGNKVTLIAAAAMFVIAIAGVIYGVLRKKDDPGFMTSATGHPLSWPIFMLPTATFFDKEFPEEYITAYRLVANELNEIIGRKVFDFGAPWIRKTKIINNVLDLPTGSVYLALSYDGTAGGSNQYRYGSSGDLQACIIRVTREYSGDLLKTILMHELGHALGLDHDPEIQASIMYPTTKGRTKSLTDKDVNRLRTTYGGLHHEDTASG